MKTYNTFDIQADYDYMTICIANCHPTKDVR